MNMPAAMMSKRWAFSPGIAPLGDLRDRVTLELISEIACPHHGLLASNLGKKASTKSRSYSLLLQPA
jgi:hypothetical protein